MLRFASLLALLLALGAAGCGGGARPQHSARQGVPHALAQRWEGRASAIAAAASGGDDCRALRLASSLRREVLSKEHRLPLRLRSPLVTGVDSLAASLTCTETVTVETTPGKSPEPGPGRQKPKPPHGPRPPHHPPGHHDHHGRGEGKDG